MKDARDWESWIDQQIREAQARGAFDDLPGKGKPVDLTPNPYARDRELAYKILKDAGYAPDWIELDKAIRAKVEGARKALARTWVWRQARRAELAARSDAGAAAERARVEAEWQRAVARFEAAAADLNREIRELNLQVPSGRFQRPLLDPIREVARLEGESA